MALAAATLIMFVKLSTPFMQTYPRPPPSSLLPAFRTNKGTTLSRCSVMKGSLPQQLQLVRNFQISEVKLSRKKNLSSFHVHRSKISTFRSGMALASVTPKSSLKAMFYVNELEHIKLTSRHLQVSYRDKRLDISYVCSNLIGQNVTTTVQVQQVHYKSPILYNKPAQLFCMFLLR